MDLFWLKAAIGLIALAAIDLGIVLYIAKRWDGER
jgi:hypothetical protein